MEQGEGVQCYKVAMLVQFLKFRQAGQENSLLQREKKIQCLSRKESWAFEFAHGYQADDSRHARLSKPCVTVKSNQQDAFYK